MKLNYGDLIFALIVILSGAGFLVYWLAGWVGYGTSSGVKVVRRITAYTTGHASGIIFVSVDSPFSAAPVVN